MKVPIEWLKELVSFRAGPDQLAEMLTMAGLETIVLPDEVLEVDILPNRSDCLSIRGIAREVSTLTKFKVKSPKFKISEAGQKINKFLRVEVRDKELCPRYMARVIQDVKVAESPDWLKKKLERAGLRSINNIVDITNYLLLEMGQPMHAFDGDLIKDQTIIVRRANPEEKVVTLDGKERVLDGETLVIADSEKVIAVAGIMGAANTEVSLGTKTVVLESAYFNPVSIHRASKILKLRTESSIRFEHGVDWEVVEEALDRGAALIAELAHGTIMRGKIDAKRKEMKAKEVDLRLARLNRILGTEIDSTEAISILKRLGFEVKKSKNNILKVKIPLFRSHDIEREIDCIEEIARIYGYGKIKTTMPKTVFFGKTVCFESDLRNKVRQILVGCGLFETQTYSMLSPSDFQLTGIPEKMGIKISNPLSVEESILRTHLLPGLLKVAVHNVNRQIENVFIFEIGKVFSNSQDKIPGERWSLGGVLLGSPFMSALDKGEVDYFYVKGIVENIFSALGIILPKIKESEHFLLQPGKGAEIPGVGIFGALHPDIQRNYGLVKQAYFFEFDLEAIFKLVPQSKKYHPLPKFPFVARDISMFVPKDLENQKILEVIYDTGGDLVENAFPFDKFQDSLAYRIIYRHPERTLTEEEVNRKHQEIIQALKSKLLVRIR